MTEEKQPWQMTAKEWWLEWDKIQINYSGCGGDPTATSNCRSGRAVSKLIERAQFLKMNLPDIPGILMRPARHIDVILHALEKGFPVPIDVLADYPDLINSISINGII